MTSECGEVVNTTDPAEGAAGSVAAFSSGSGLSLYTPADDKVRVIDENTSPFGLMPRFRTAEQVSFVRQREPSDDGHLWGQDTVYEVDLRTGDATELVRLPNHIMAYDWSPDGAILLYLLRAEEGPELLAAQLCAFEPRRD